MESTVSSIEETIRSAVPEVSNYGGYLGAAVAALQEREMAIADTLRLIGQEQGIPSNTVEQALRRCGLVQSMRSVARPGPTAADSDDREKMLSQLDDLAQQIAELRRQWGSGS